MKLTDLDACFVAQYDAAKDSFHEQDDLNGAQGVMFICPLCQKETILCWFANPVNAPKVPDSAFPNPGRWTTSGTGIADLTLSPSVNLDTESARQSEAKGYHPCKWHGWVKNGEAQ